MRFLLWKLFKQFLKSLPSRLSDGINLLERTLRIMIKMTFGLYSPVFIPYNDQPRMRGYVCLWMAIVIFHACYLYRTPFMLAFVFFAPLIAAGLLYYTPYIQARAHKQPETEEIGSPDDETYFRTKMITTVLSIN